MFQASKTTGGDNEDNRDAVLKMLISHGKENILKQIRMSQIGYQIS